MQRYFLEVAYKGTNYSGFQVQANANTIQAEVEKGLAILFRQPFQLTGSSRTDAGVHALQNFFHFDSPVEILPKSIYNLNSILPADIVAKGIYRVNNDSHCRFNAGSREYEYRVFNEKNPFLQQTAYYFPYKVDMEKLQAAAELIKNHTDFTSFSKRNTQVKTNLCSITYSQWSFQNECLVYNVTGNRFLRGMVRGLVATMLKAARGQLTIEQFKTVIESRNCINADFSAPSHGLFLMKVNYSSDVLLLSQEHGHVL